MPPTTTSGPWCSTALTSGSPDSSSSGNVSVGVKRTRLLVVAAIASAPGRSRAIDPAVVDQRHAVTQSLGLLHEVGHEHDRHAAGAYPLDQPPRVAAGLRVKAGGELVEHGDLGPADQREHD